MNKINFARPSATKKTVLTKKFRWPLIVCLVIITCMVTLQTIQWISLYSIQSKKQCIAQQLAPFDHTVCDKQALNDKLPILEKTVRTIENAQPDRDPFLSLYHTINTLLGTGSLEALTITGKRVELSLCLDSVKTAQAFIDKLAELPAISSVELGAIHKGTTGLIFTLEAKLA